MNNVTLHTLKCLRKNKNRIILIIFYTTMTARATITGICYYNIIIRFVSVVKICDGQLRVTCTRIRNITSYAHFGRLRRSNDNIIPSLRLFARGGNLFRPNLRVLFGKDSARVVFFFSPSLAERILTITFCRHSNDSIDGVVSDENMISTMHNTMDPLR